MLNVKKTLVSQFTLIMLLIFVVGQGVLYTWLLLYQKSYLQERLEHEITAVASHIADVVAAQGPEHPALKQYVDFLLKGESVYAITVETNGKVYVSSRPREDDRDGFSLNPFSIFLIADENSATVRMTQGAREIGTVRIQYSGRAVNEVMKRFLVIPPVMQLLTLIIIIISITRFFRKKVAGPVGEINDVLARITAGDLTTRLPEVEDNEIGTVNRGLQFLLDKLSSAIARFHSLSGNVAAAMGQLTVTLKNVSSSLAAQSRSIDDVITAIKSANEAQKTSTNHTDSLARASTDVVSSLLEMKAAAEEIALSTGRLFKSAEDSYTVIAEMSQSAKEIAESADHVTHAVETTSASVEEMTASLKAVTENTRQSTELASRVQTLLTESGTKTVAQAMGAMEKIAADVNYSAEIITRLDQRSRDIEKILSVIKEVTEKTNLLSLNAAILAAQAGEYGKSFSVVADEIRTLSDKTSASAKDISLIVKTIQAEIRDAAHAIVAAVKKVLDGKTLITRSGDAMGSTLEAAQHSSTMAKKIEKASEEQSDALNQIKFSMENIRMMIEQVAKATDEERKGSAYILESIGDVKEVAELVKKGTQEHATGTEIISKNMDLAMDMVSQISRAAREQVTVNESITRAVEQMKQTGTSIIKDMGEVMTSFGTLTSEVEILKKEMELFKTGGRQG